MKCFYSQHEVTAINVSSSTNTGRLADTGTSVTKAPPLTIGTPNTMLTGLSIITSTVATKHQSLRPL